jgi:hypothetical protein
MNRTVEGLISTVCTRYEHVNLKVLSGQRLCAVRFRKRTSAVIRGESPATRKLPQSGCNVRVGDDPGINDDKGVPFSIRGLRIGCDRNDLGEANKRQSDEWPVTRQAHRVLKGHDFSRAKNAAKKDPGFSP